jgi:hypothetical protein
MKKKKVVISCDHGGYGLSRAAIKQLARVGLTRDCPRDSLDLVYIVKNLKRASWGECATLKIVEIEPELGFKINMSASGAEWLTTIFFTSKQELIDGLGKRRLALAMSADEIKIKKLTF